METTTKVKPANMSYAQLKAEAARLKVNFIGVRLPELTKAVEKAQQEEEKKKIADAAKPAAPAKEKAASKKEKPVRGTKIKEILELHKAGKTVEEIVKKGYHKTTVQIQTRKYDKENGGKKKK